MSTSRSTLLKEAGVEVVSYFPCGTWPTPPGLPEKQMYAHSTAEIESVFEAYTPNSPGRSNWNSFEHYVRGIGTPVLTELVTPSDMTGVWPASGGRHWRGIHKDIFFGWTQHSGLGKVLNPLQLLYDTSLEKGFVPFPSNLAALKQQALKAMLPSVRPDLSLMNSIFELKDFKGIVKGLLSKLPKLKSLLQGKASLKAVRDSYINRIKTLRLRLSLLKKGNKAQLLRELDAATAAYLQWKFAIAPLISDLEAISRNLVTHEKKINDLVSREGSPQRRHFTSDADYFDDYDKEQTFNMGYPMYPDVYGICSIKTSSSGSTAKFHAEIEYCYNFTQYQREHARTLGLLDSLGVNFNPKIIWDALPYSFIVDWVLGVGQYLDQFRVENMEPLINIRRFLWSCLYSRRTNWSKRLGFDSGNDVMYHARWEPMPSVSETSYKRRVEGISASSVILGGLNSNEFLLGAALVYARRRRRKPQVEK